MKNHLLTLLTVCLTASLATTAQAEVTAPVGYVKLTFNDTSDTPFSLPMNRPKVFAGKVASVAGNVITVENGAFTPSDYVYLDGTQNEKYYVLFTTGSLEGRTFDITANTATTITVNQDGDTTVQALINDAMATDLFEIRPHWTLNTVFPDGANFDKSTDVLNTNGLIMVRPETLPGENIPPTITYFYYDSATNSEDGWYDANDLAAGKASDVILKRSVFYVCKNTSDDVYTVNLVGDVPLVDHKNKLRINSDFIQQGNYISLPFPVEVTLAESGLAESASFMKTTDVTNINGDRILAYEDNITTYNPAASSVYVYYDSATNSEDGWYDANDLAAGKQDATAIFKPGKGYIISKQGATEEIFQWNIEIPYTPLSE